MEAGFGWISLNFKYGGVCFTTRTVWNKEYTIELTKYSTENVNNISKEYYLH